MFLRRETSTSVYAAEIAKRAADLCSRIETDMTPAEMYEFVWRMFAAGDGRFGCWFIVKDGAVVGHLIAHPEPLTGPWKHVLIRQADVDPNMNVMAECRAIFSSVRKWASDAKISKIRVVTHRNIAPIMRRWGFRPYKSIMEADVDIPS